MLAGWFVGEHDAPLPVRGLLLLGHWNNAPRGLPDSHTCTDAPSDARAHGYTHPGPDRDSASKRERERKPDRVTDQYPNRDALGFADPDPAAQSKRHA